MAKPYGLRNGGKDQGNASLITHAFWQGGQTSRRMRDSSAPDDFFYLDAAKRLDEIFTNHPTATYDVRRSWTLNPAGQVADETMNNNLFADDPLPVADVAYTPNGLNQYAQVDGFAQTYDLNGNLTISRQSDGQGGTLSTSFVYDTENRLVSASGQNNVDLRYDPFGRLYQVTDSGSNITRFHYDGDALIGEYNASGTQLQRYIHGPGAGDDPLIRYPGSSTARNDAHYLYADRLGSIVQEVKRDGTVTVINSYDAYGIPGASSGINNLGRFRYTGQTWIPELGMYYYKARMYSPTLGRFMQTDPIGYSDGMNVQTYVGNDPVNGVDPLGLCRFELWGMVRRTYDQDGNEIGEPEILYTYAKQVSECESSGLLDKALFKELERHDTSYSKIRAVVRQNPDGYSDPTTVTICTIGGTAIPTGLATIYGANTTLAIYNRLKPAGPGTRIYGDGKGSRIRQVLKGAAGKVSRPSPTKGNWVGVVSGLAVGGAGALLMAPHVEEVCSVLSNGQA